MYFWAKARLEEEGNAYHLLRAFFNEFDPRSSIVIQGREVEAKIYFETQLPTASVDAISYCDVEKFVYNGEMLHECNETDAPEQTEPKATTEETPEQTKSAEPTTETEEIPENPKQTSAPAEEVPKQPKSATPAQSEEPKKETGWSATKKAESTKAVNEGTTNIPALKSELEKFAKRATSFENFANLVAEWLEMGVTYQDFFVNLVLASIEVDKISWDKLSVAMQNKKQFFSDTHKNVARQKVSKKLKGYSVTMLPLLKMMRQYKDYQFGQHQSKEKSCTEEVSEQTATEGDNPEQTAQENVECALKRLSRMDCMPVIPPFEEILGSVDKTKPIDDRVKYVLKAMGWNNLEAEEQEEIFEIASSAVRIEKMDLYRVYNIMYIMKSVPSTHDWDEARMTFAKFINDFVSQYDSSKKVKLEDFLRDLQKVLMNESEIKSYEDFLCGVYPEVRN